MRTLAGLILLAGYAAADNYPRQMGVDALHYVFRVTLGENGDEIAGEATADIRFLSAGVRTVSLDLANVAGGKGMAVAGVTSKGAVVRFTHQNDVLVLSVPGTVAAGERRQFTVRYRGTPASGLVASKNLHGDRGVFSANWPNLARQWLPIIDHPYDKATSEFLVTAPVKYQVVANGVLAEERELGDGRRLTHWRQHQPIASWLNAVGVAEFSVKHFATVRGIPLQTWVPYQEREAGIATFESASRQALEFMSDFVGPYPYNKLANIWAWVPGFGGGTEHAGAIFYSCCKTSTGVVWHEIVHQWFGDAVTEKDWNDVWLSEGFTTYFTHLVREHYEGRDAFIAGLKADRPRIFAAESKFPSATVIHADLADMKSVLQPGAVFYQKGSWVLHMLRGQIGFDSFGAGIREYYRLYRDKNAATDDFRRVMEEASGQDLREFFGQWLQRTPSPVVEGAWQYNAGTKKVEVTLTQTQGGDAYRLPLEFGLTIAGQTRLEKVEFSMKQQRFEMAVEAEPSAVVLDPNTWVLMESRFGKK